MNTFPPKPPPTGPWTSRVHYYDPDLGTEGGSSVNHDMDEGVVLRRTIGDVPVEVAEDCQTISGTDERDYGSTYL